MTADEGFERIEHVTAALAEERRRDREEYKQLWRDSQRRMDELTANIAATNDTIARLAQETDKRIARLAEESDKRIARLAEESRDQDRRLGERIDALVSAIGQFLGRQ